jgi:hypothetical protein
MLLASSGSFLLLLGPPLIIAGCNDGIFNKNSERGLFPNATSDRKVERFSKPANFQRKHKNSKNYTSFSENKRYLNI